MSLKRYRLRPVSSVGTPLRSDTLAGQLLCLYAEQHGQEKMNALAEQLRSGEVPFVLSDAFPEGCLPCPVLPAIPRQTFEALSQQHPAFKDGGLFEAMRQFKRFKAVRFLTLEQWQRHREVLSLKNLLLDFLGGDAQGQPSGPQAKTVAELHNIIDRHTERTLETGGMFTSETTWYGSQTGNASSALDLYVWAEDTAWHEEVNRLLLRMGQLGFGRDASTGKGHFHLGDPEEAGGLLECPEANAAMTLSTCATTRPQEVTGWYNLRPKFGKVWNGFGEMRPFKKPMLMFDPGSVFTRFPEGYGHGILSGVHRTNPNILQHAAALRLPVCVEYLEAA